MEKIIELAKSTGSLERVILWGSFVSNKEFPQDIDLLLLFKDDLIVESVGPEAKPIFDHVQARILFNADIFWSKSSLGQETLDLCKKVKAVVDDRAEAHYPTNMSGVARVEIEGESFEKMVVDPKGEPNNFLSDAEMRNKFDTLAAPYLDPESLDQLAKGILDLDRQTNIHGLLDLTRPQSAAVLKAV